MTTTQKFPSLDHGVELDHVSSPAAGDLSGALAAPEHLVYTKKSNILYIHSTFNYIGST